MTFPRVLTLTSVLALTVAGPALADLTAEQVLADQLRQIESYGLTAKVTNQSRSGDTLVVEGLSAAASTPEADMRMEMGGATFRELGDGSVEITYPAEIPIVISGTAETGEEFAMQMSVSQTNTRVLVSGIPEEIRYDYTAEAVTINDLKFVAPEEAAELDMTFDVVMNGLVGVMEFQGGGPVRDYTADFTIDSIAGGFSGAPEPDEGEIALQMEMQNLTLDYSGSMGAQDLMASFAQSIAAGNTSQGTATHGPLTYTFKGDTPDGTFDVAGSVASGDFDFKMDEAGLDYGRVSRDMTVSVAGSVIPFPTLTFKMAETGGRFAMPVVPSEDDQDFALLIDMKGLEIDQMLWGMFDPAGQIPRDPANLVIDLEGVAKLTEDVFAPEFAEQMTGAPGELKSLDVNRILLNLAGAELTGDGALSFNTMGGIPMPVGAVNLMLTGGNGLLDTLVNMGLLPQEQAMGARMMMGLFAVPGDGPDTLVSTIEMKEDGSILANGQRIK